MIYKISKGFYIFIAKGLKDPSALQQAQGRLSSGLTNRGREFPGKNYLQAFFPLIIAFTIASGLNAQDGYTRPPVTDKEDQYLRQVRADSTKKMIELKELIPGLVYDLRYASINNFMHRLMYPANTSHTFLRRPAARALLNVQNELYQGGMGLKIFDAYRPFSVTVKFWELVKDERYVANPSKGSGHNRGIAVDLTIINLKTGRELDMGTGFDNFTDSAHHSFNQYSAEILQNRQLLRSVMGKQGFRALESEWWHYFLSDGSRFEILDLDFKKLKKLL